MKVGLPFVEGFFRADGWDWKLIGPSLNAFRYVKLMRQPVFANAEDVCFLGCVGLEDLFEMVTVVYFLF